MLVKLQHIMQRVRNSPLASRFLSGATWSVVGSAISNIINLGTIMVLARILGKEPFGQFVALQSTVAMIGIFAGFGIGATATKYSAELKSTDIQRLGRILWLASRVTWVAGVLMALAMMLFASTIARVSLSDPTLKTPLILASASVLFLAIDGLQKSILIGFESMRQFALSSAISAVVGVPIILASTIAYGLNGAAAALSITALLQALISLRFVSRVLYECKVSITRNGVRKEWRTIWDFAIPALISGVLVAPAHWVCQTMLADQSRGYAELALLGVAMQWFNAIIFFPTVTGKVVLPILTEKISRSNHLDSKRLLLLAISVNACIAIPLASVAAIVAPAIMSLYGDKFLDGTAALKVAAFTAALLAIQMPVGAVIVASAKMWLGVAMNFGWAIVYLGGCYLLISYGALGVLGAMGIAYVCHTVWTFFFARRFVRSTTSVACTS